MGVQYAKIRVIRYCYPSIVTPFFSVSRKVVWITTKVREWTGAYECAIPFPHAEVL
jgi:hypothetical protein